MKFTIHNLARIDDAQFEIKNLTIFVGKNSTNKSYASHIVYKLNKILSHLKPKSNNFNQLFIQYIKDENNNHLIESIKSLEKKIVEREVTEYDDDLLQLLMLDDEVREVVFSFDNFNINGLIENVDLYITNYITNEINKSFNINSNILKKIKIIDTNDINILDNNQIKIVSSEEESDHIRLLQFIFKQVVEKYYNTKAAQEEFYFPASRTGFVLAFDEIVSGVLRDRFGGQPTATKLTEPTIDFISGFSDIKSGKFGDELKTINLFERHQNSNTQKKKMKELFEFIENRIIKGKIIEEKKEQNYTQFYLKPKNSNKLELHLTSSATVELLPLVVFLKHFSKIEDRLLVIEEPEAHLHPKAQIEMARLLVMLVNAGAKVLVTTHSDYILNEISNCIKLFDSNQDKVKQYLKKLKLSQDTIISKDDVSAYLFKDSNEKTEVIPLIIDKYGIANDNFDDILDELLDRTQKINEFLGI
jgi:predicted ATPase